MFTFEAGVILFLIDEDFRLVNIGHDLILIHAGFSLSHAFNERQGLIVKTHLILLCFRPAR